MATIWASDLTFVTFTAVVNSLRQRRRRLLNHHYVPRIPYGHVALLKRVNTIKPFSFSRQTVLLQ